MTTNGASRATEAFFGRRRGQVAAAVAGGGPDEGASPATASILLSRSRRSGRAVPCAGATIRLEIGFGGGEHLFTMRGDDPDAGFIGVEPFVNGMAKLLAASGQETARQFARL